MNRTLIKEQKTFDSLSSFTANPVCTHTHDLNASRLRIPLWAITAIAFYRQLLLHQIEIQNLYTRLFKARFSSKIRSEQNLVGKKPLLWFAGTECLQQISCVSLNQQNANLGGKVYLSKHEDLISTHMILNRKTIGFFSPFFFKM